VELKDIIRRWFQHPRLFVQEGLCVEKITGQQEQALEALEVLVNAKDKRAKGQKLSEQEAAVVDKIGMSIQSGKGTGKDAFCAWAILWFLVCFPHPRVPCLGPTQHQMRDVLWGEIAKWMRHSAQHHRLANSAFIIDEWLTWQTDRVYYTDYGGREWYAVSRTANPRASAEEQRETLSGFHEDYLMVVADEAASIPDVVFEQLETTLTGKVNFCLVVFNPTRRTGFAIETQTRERKRWLCLQWNAEESTIVSRESIEYKARKFGRTSNQFRVTVLGLPPKADSDALIPYEHVIECVDRDDVWPLDTDPVVIGIDVGAGNDPTVYVHRRGPLVSRIDTTETDQSEIVTNWCLRKILEDEPFMVYVDTIGVGWGIEGNLRQRSSVNVIGVKVSELAAERERFHRLRDELYDRLREKFEKREIVIPNDDTLIGELTTIRKGELNGKLKIESKADLRKRGIDSPNRADALALTEYYGFEQLRRLHRKGGYRRRRIENWKTL